jgi:hypothetical protein
MSFHSDNAHIVIYDPNTVHEIFRSEFRGRNLIPGMPSQKDVPPRFPVYRSTLSKQVQLSAHSTTEQILRKAQADLESTFFAGCAGLSPATHHGGRLR